MTDASSGIAEATTSASVPTAAPLTNSCAAAPPSAPLVIAAEAAVSHPLEADGFTSAALADHPVAPLPGFARVFPNKPAFRAAVQEHAAVVGGFHYNIRRETDRVFVFECYKQRRLGCKASVGVEKGPEGWVVNRREARHVHILDEVPKEYHPKAPKPKKGKKQRKRGLPAKKQLKQPEDGDEDAEGEADKEADAEGEVDADAEGEADGTMSSGSVEDDELGDPTFHDPGTSTSASPSGSTLARPSTSLLLASRKRKRAPAPLQTDISPSASRTLPQLGSGSSEGASGPADQLKGENVEFGPTGRPVRSRKAPARFAQEYEHSPKGSKKKKGPIPKGKSKGGEQAEAEGPSPVQTASNNTTSSAVTDVLPGRGSAIQPAPPPMTLEEQQRWLADRERAHASFRNMGHLQQEHHNYPRFQQPGVALQQGYRFPQQQALQGHVQASSRRLPPSALTITVPSLPHGPPLGPQSQQNQTRPPPSPRYACRAAISPGPPAVGMAGWGAPISTTMQNSFAAQQQQRITPSEDIPPHLVPQQAGYARSRASGWREPSPPLPSIANARLTANRGGSADQHQAQWTMAQQQSHASSHPGTVDHRSSISPSAEGHFVSSTVADHHPQHTQHLPPAYSQQSYYPPMTSAAQPSLRVFEKARMPSAPQGGYLPAAERQGFQAVGQQHAMSPSPLGSPAHPQGDLPLTGAPPYMGTTSSQVSSSGYNSQPPAPYATQNQPAQPPHVRSHHPPQPQPHSQLPSMGPSYAHEPPYGGQCSDGTQQLGNGHPMPVNHPVYGQGYFPHPPPEYDQQGMLPPLRRPSLAPPPHQYGGYAATRGYPPGPTSSGFGQSPSPSPGTAQVQFPSHQYPQQLSPYASHQSQSLAMHPVNSGMVSSGPGSAATSPYEHPVSEHGYGGGPFWDGGQGPGVQECLRRTSSTSDGSGVGLGITDDEGKLGFDFPEQRSEPSQVQ